MRYVNVLDGRKIDVDYEPIGEAWVRPGLSKTAAKRLAASIRRDEKSPWHEKSDEKAS